MTRRGWTKLGLSIGIPVLAVVLLVIFWNWDWFIPIVESQASAQLGRRVTLTHLHVHLGRTTRIVADDVVAPGSPTSALMSTSWPISMTASSRSRASM
jgi:hypothetical protein